MRSTIKGTLYQSFDDSLTLLLALLERTLPGKTCCDDPAFIEWEMQSYQALCEHALRDMAERAERLVVHRCKKTEMLATDAFCYDNHSDILQRLESQQGRQTEQGRALIDQLKQSLLRLLNHELTDEEYEAKWEVLKRKASYKRGDIPHDYSDIVEFCDEHDPDEKTLSHYILQHNSNENDMMGFMQGYVRNQTAESFRMVEEKATVLTNSAVAASGCQQLAYDNEDEKLKAALMNIFFKDEEEIAKFIKFVRCAKPVQITAKVNELVKAGIISNMSQHRDLWKILHDAHLYTHTEQNWNKQVK